MQSSLIGHQRPSASLLSVGNGDMLLVISGDVYCLLQASAFFLLPCGNHFLPSVTPEVPQLQTMHIGFQEYFRWLLRDSKSSSTCAHSVGSTSGCYRWVTNSCKTWRCTNSLYCAHRFYEAGNQTEHSGEGFFLLHDIWSPFWEHRKVGDDLSLGIWNHLEVFSVICLMADTGTSPEALDRHWVLSLPVASG